MARLTEPGRQLASAARSILSPLGCKQIGRSRTWIADQRFWAIVIEFQPSSFSKGSYLNVGASWLWDVKDYWSFDYGGRVEGFNRFGDEHQFAVMAEKLSLLAADEVRMLRGKFASLGAIARELTPSSNATGWPVYHAAVAAGLIGDVAAAESHFNRLGQETATAEWHKKLQKGGAELAQNLRNRDGFREAILAIIQQSRALLDLPPDPTCLDAAY
jgi:hypothetical protein